MSKEQAAREYAEIQKQHEFINAKTEAYIQTVKDAANNLGLGQLNEAALSGRTQGYYAGFKDGMQAHNLPSVEQITAVAMEKELDGEPFYFRFSSKDFWEIINYAQRRG